MPISNRLLLTLLLAQPSADSAEGAAPLGSAILVESTSGAAGIRLAAVSATQYPWQPICYYLSSPINDEEIVQAFQELPSGAMVIRPIVASSEPRDVCIAALRRASPPTVTQFAEYIAARVGNPDLSVVLRAALEPNATHHRSTLSRQLVKVGFLTAQEWRAVYSLAIALPGKPQSATWAGSQVDREGRTIRRWSQEYLGVDFRVARDRLGWRWIPEAALRTAGIVRGGTAEARMEA